MSDISNSDLSYVKTKSILAGKLEKVNMNKIILCEINRSYLEFFMNIHWVFL